MAFVFTATRGSKQEPSQEVARRSCIGWSIGEFDVAPNLTNAQRDYLRRQAHDLKPVVQIGKLGLTENARMTVDHALQAHELIKVKFHGWGDEKRQLTDTLVEATDSVLISLLGNIATLYRRQPDPDKRKFVLPL
jgi:RNA-binding protein